MVAKIDDELPNFDNLDDLMSPGDDDLAPLEPILDEPGLEELTAETPILEEPAESTAEGEPAMVEGEPPELDAETPDVSEEKPARKAVALPLQLEWIAVIGIAVAVFALAFMNLVTFGTAMYVSAVVVVIGLMWISRARSTIYTMLLACALVAVMTAVYCLWTELGRYHFNMSGKLRASVSAPGDVCRIV
jgi:hypothetical protein